MSGSFLPSLWSSKQPQSTRVKEPTLLCNHDCLVPLGLTVTAAAKVLGVSRQALNNLLNGKAGVTPEMAIRLEKAFGGTADTWCACR
jgi:addiction module HigA family antidote